MCDLVEEKLFTTYINFITFEELLERHNAELEKERIPGYEIIDTTLIIAQDNFQKCKACGGFQELVTPLCAMQPDTMWSGVNTNQGYFTSKSKYLNNLKERNIETLTSRSDFENVRKSVRKAKIAKIQKEKNNLEKFLTKELKGVTIDPDGNTVKERNNYVKSRSTE